VLPDLSLLPVTHRGEPYLRRRLLPNAGVLLRRVAWMDFGADFSAPRTVLGNNMPSFLPSFKCPTVNYPEWNGDETMFGVEANISKFTIYFSTFYRFWTCGEPKSQKVIYF
jgi:hypothetical protein